MKPTLTVVIPTYNGKHLLKKHLPQVIKVFPDAKILIIDDASTDGTQKFLHQNYPQIKILVNTHNLGFTVSVNQAIAAVDTDLFVLTNNDVHPLPGLLTPALPLLRRPDVFAVTFAEKDSSWPQVSIHFGQIRFTNGLDRSQPRFSAWGSGGSCVFKRQIWNQLGGFNPIYSPGYWEDIDLGWRAWKAGFKIIWHPKCKVIHQHESTFKRFNQTTIRRIKERNELLFNIQNITEPKLKFQRILHLPFFTLLHPGYIRIIWMALLRLKQTRPCPTVLTDTQILNLVNSPCPSKSR